MMIGGSTGSAFSTAVGGMLSSSANMNSDSLTIARTGTTAQSNDPLGDLTMAMVDMKINQHVFDASAKVIKTADEMLGTLLDIQS